jgi:hypothetical protein
LAADWRRNATQTVKKDQDMGDCADLIVLQPAGQYKRGMIINYAGKNAVFVGKR